MWNVEMVRNRESFGGWFSLTDEGPSFVSVRCFLGSERDMAVWFHRSDGHLMVAYACEKRDSSVLLEFSLIGSFCRFLDRVSD